MSVRLRESRVRRMGLVSAVESVEELDLAVSRRSWRVGAARNDLGWPGRGGQGEGPGAVGGGKACGPWLALDLQDEDLAWIKDDVAGLVVEVARGLGGWNRYDEICAVVGGPGVAGELEAQPDAAPTPAGIYGYGVHHGYVLDDDSACVIVGHQREVLGFLHVGADEGRTLDGIVAASHYQFSVQSVVTLDGCRWKRYGARVADLLTQEPAGPLYVFLRGRDINGDAGRVWRGWGASSVMREAQYEGNRGTRIPVWARACEGVSSRE